VCYAKVAQPIFDMMMMNTMTLRGFAMKHQFDRYKIESTKITFHWNVIYYLFIFVFVVYLVSNALNNSL